MAPVAPTPAVREISQLVSQSLDGLEAINMYRLVHLVRQVNPGLSTLNDASRVEFIESAGRMLTRLAKEQQVRNSRIDYTGFGLKNILTKVILKAFKAQPDELMLPYLGKYCFVMLERHRHEAFHGTTAATALSLFEQLGGQTPVLNSPPSAKEVGELTQKLADLRLEVDTLIERAGAEKLSAYEQTKIVQRLRELSDPRSLDAVLGILQRENAMSVVLQDGIRALGSIGGTKAVSYCVQVLEAPMPANADVDDFSATQAMHRAAAARSLSECGDASVLPLLERLAADGKQFKRVRQACKHAVYWIRQREEGVRPKTLPKTPTVADLAALQEAYDASQRELDDLMARAAAQPLTPGEQWKTVRRLAEIGDARSTETIQTIIEMADAYPITRRDGLRALGALDGKGAQAYLLQRLRRPMPAGANLEIYGDAEAALRVCAARVLGECGDDDAKSALEGLAGDAAQYQLVRKACQQAAESVAQSPPATFDSSNRP